MAMYLKNLTVLGFKSFADKTSLNFQRGVTAIVGPNGCGKSNVSDAIRWVLGEQSPKALRGGEMVDVIFNGTDGRKPLGMAEVSLTIGGVDQEHLTAAGVELSYDEVTITRRVFRDGGSEYFINKTPCRLKDIQQLFMGTGVGRTSYSIMAQGNITQILSSKPDDRRMVFEEAAGITKFKAQKRETLRKLEHTDQNLLRVADLIREVKRQIGSLQRQAGKARRYKQLMVELQHLDTQLARHHFDVLQTEIGEKTATVEQVRAQIEADSQKLLQRETQLAQQRELLSELDQEIGQTQRRSLELKSEMDRHESRIGFNRERLQELENQNAKALRDIAESEERKVLAEEELKRVAARCEASATALRQQKEALEVRRAALGKVETELQAKQNELRQGQADAFAAAQRLSNLRNEINSIDLQKQGNLVRLEKLSAEKIQLEEERGRVDTRLKEFFANVEAEKVNVEARRGTIEQRQQRMRDIETELALVSEELDGALRRQAEQRSKLNLLRQLDESHEGFEAGALAALHTTHQLLGSLADKIRVPEEYVVAIESALGGNLQLVLAEAPETAEQILGELKREKRGRARIASLALPASEARPAGESFSNPRGRSALQVVQAEPSVQPLIERLLERTVIVPDLGTATAVWRETHGHFDFVTPAGEILNRHGIFSGGYLNGHGSGKTPASILGRKNQIADLETQIAQAQELINDVSRRKGGLLGEQTALMAGLEQARSELRNQEVAIATHQGECNALENSHRGLHQKIDTVIYEIQSLAAQDAEGKQKRDARAVELVEIEGTELRQQERVAALGGEVEELRVRRDQATSALTETKVALATEEQLCASFTNQRIPLEERIAELTELARRRQQDLGSFLDRRKQAEGEIAESESAMKALERDRAAVERQAGELLERRQEREEEINAGEEAMRLSRQQVTRLQEQRGAIEVELAQKNMSVQNLRERVTQKYHVNLDDIRSECITITLADDGPARVQTLTPDEMAASGAATDWNAVAGQVEALQHRIDEMGPVNLVAIEEYEETEQRYQFLTKQNDDLIKAKQHLLEVINRINTQTKEMFIETFARIRENFRAMFTEIFGGGKADLVLVDEGDVLESGIDIVARPPGKQLQNISLLSGGEQTMTAVALLFSIYQVKPSPFCVLDELDAPLDESNINRFIRVLQRFLTTSQFVIITHNKRTIGMADILYGVTMQEQGVSKIVSVKFHKADEQVTDHRPELLVPPPPLPPVEAEEDASHTTEETIDIVLAR